MQCPLLLQREAAEAALRIRMEARMQTSKKIRTAGRQLCWLSLSCIRPNAQQPRQEFDEFALLELAASIRENGLLQPVTVRPCEDGYELIMGERRCRACRMLGHTHIEAFILPADDEESALLALVENMQRRDLHFFEEAQAYERLCEKGMTQEMLSRMLGKSAGAVNNRLRLLKLEPAVRELIVENHLSERHARALLPLPGESARLRICQQAIMQKLSVQKTEELVAKALERLPLPAPSRKVISLVRDHRLYINAIRGIVDQLRDTGMDAKCEVNEYDSAVEIRVVMPRNKTNKKNPAM